MKNESVIKTCITPHVTIEIDTEDGNPPKVWKLAYTYGAIAKVESLIKRDIKKLDDWKDLSSGSEFPVIVWGGLDKFNPEVTLEEVKEMLNPECQRILSDAIFELCFPGVKEAYEKALAEQAEQKETGASASPNV
jgi:hypothetical protein